MLKIQNLSKSFGPVRLFDQVSMEISQAQWIALSGESGSGKTTLLRILMGFENPDAGSIWWDDQPLWEQGVARSESIRQFRQILAWTPQQVMFPQQTAHQVWTDLHQFHRNHPLQNLDASASWISELGLEAHLLHQPFSQLSGGQQQRMLIGLGFSLQRKLWILDEPTSALDQRSKRRVVNLLRQRSQHTLLFSTHDTFLLDQCDRVFHLEHGHIQEVH
jgi:ABC-type multidrug transport system ATPase subunit